MATCASGADTHWNTLPTEWKVRDKLAGTRTFYSRLDDADVLAAVQGGWDAWSSPDGCSTFFEAVYGGTTAASALSSSADNVVEFLEDGWDPALGDVGGVIAITFVKYDPITCALTDADQVYNGVGFHFTTSASQVDTDLQSITTHENGHWLGLGHSPKRSATMYASYPGGTSQRTLYGDDENGVCSLYPAGGSAGGSGGSDCGMGCGVRRLEGPGQIPWAFFGLVGFTHRRRRRHPPGGTGARDGA